jgi:hypothetical protein
MTTATKPAPRAKKKYSGRNTHVHSSVPHAFMIRIPEELLTYLRERADRNFRSVNLEVMAMLYGLKREEEAAQAQQGSARRAG